MKSDDTRALDFKDLASNPFDQFDRWFAVAQGSRGPNMPEAACLSTVSADGYPEGRIVLIKARDSHGFLFYTNLYSAKGRALDENPRAALTFFWEKLGAQVRIQGDVERVSDVDADAYFASRSRSGQIKAWASDQSTELASREALLARIEAMTAEYEGRSIPAPPYWGGFRILPVQVEFWHGMPDRLHDRFLYRRSGDGWDIKRLNP